MSAQRCSVFFVYRLCAFVCVVLVLVLVCVARDREEKREGVGDVCHVTIESTIRIRICVLQAACRAGLLCRGW
jgi:hypothetical protein